MKSTSANTNCAVCIVLAWACVSTPVLFAAQQPVTSAVPHATAAGPPGAKTFDTPQHAADALVAAAENFDVAALTEIFGPDGSDIVLSGEFSQDRKHAADFAAQARQKKSVSVDPKSGTRAFLLVGNEDWPFLIPAGLTTM